jgi:hypothetical protein
MKRYLAASLKDKASLKKIMDILEEVEAVALTQTELTYLDAVTAGTAAASKAVVLSAAGKIATITDLVATNVNMTTMTVGATVINEADITQIDGITKGTAAANKALVLGTAGAITLVDNSVVTTGSGNGVKFGAANTDKIGFFGTTPAAQPAGIANTGAAVNSNNVGDLPTTVNAIIAHLETLGLIATV